MQQTTIRRRDICNAPGPAGPWSGRCACGRAPVSRTANGARRAVCSLMHANFDMHPGASHGLDCRGCSLLHIMPVDIPIDCHATMSQKSKNLDVSS